MFALIVGALWTAEVFEPLDILQWLNATTEHAGRAWDRLPRTSWEGGPWILFVGGMLWAFLTEKKPEGEIGEAPRKDEGGAV